MSLVGLQRFLAMLALGGLTFQKMKRASFSDFAFKLGRGMLVPWRFIVNRQLGCGVWNFKQDAAERGRPSCLFLAHFSRPACYNYGFGDAHA